MSWLDVRFRKFMKFGAALVEQEGTSAGEAKVSDATVVGRFAQVTPATGDFTDEGPHELKAPASGNALRVIWLYAQAVAALGTGAVEVTFKLGAATLYTVELTGSQPWAHAAVLPPGAVDAPLTVTMNIAGVRLLCNADVREFTP